MKKFNMFFVFAIMVSIAMLVGCGGGGSSSNDPDGDGGAWLLNNGHTKIYNAYASMSVALKEPTTTGVSSSDRAASFTAFVADDADFGKDSSGNVRGKAALKDRIESVLNSYEINSYSIAPNNTVSHDGTNSSDDTLVVEESMASLKATRKSDQLVRSRDGQSVNLTWKKQADNSWKIYSGLSDWWADL